MKRFDLTSPASYSLPTLFLTLLLIQGCGGQSSETTLIEPVEMEDPISQSERNSAEYMEAMKGDLEKMLEEEGQEGEEGSDPQ